MSALSYDILTDRHTDPAWVRDLIDQSTKADWLRLNNQFNLAVHDVDDNVWSLDASTLYDTALALEYVGRHDIVVHAAVPHLLRNDEAQATMTLEQYEDEVEAFKATSVSTLARNIAEELVYESDDCQNVSGHSVHGKNTVPIIVVHRDTTQEVGFWPLVRAIRIEQSKRSLPLVAVYVHDNTSRLRLLEEPVVTTRNI